MFLDFKPPNLAVYKNYMLEKETEALNPNQIQRGYKVPKAFLNAYHFVYDEIWIINPSCKYLFWC